MTNFDFSPLFRSTIGFDRLANLLDEGLLTEAGGYPPYNIEVTDENAYRITMAVAGFSEAEISIVHHENELLVSGERKERDDKTQYLYRGIAARAFERRFQVADYVKVTGARLENGLLQIDLVRELPEALRPRKIEITRGSGPQRLSSKAA